MSKSTFDATIILNTCVRSVLRTFWVAWKRRGGYVGVIFTFSTWCLALSFRKDRFHQMRYHKGNRISSETGRGSTCLMERYFKDDAKASYFSIALFSFVHIRMVKKIAVEKWLQKTKSMGICLKLYDEMFCWCQRTSICKEPLSIQEDFSFNISGVDDHCCSWVYAHKCSMWCPRKDVNTFPLAFIIWP